MEARTKKKLVNSTPLRILAPLSLKNAEKGTKRVEQRRIKSGSRGKNA